MIAANSLAESEEGKPLIVPFPLSIAEAKYGAVTILPSRTTAKKSPTCCPDHAAKAATLESLKPKATAHVPVPWSISAAAWLESMSALVN